MCSTSLVICNCYVTCYWFFIACLWTIGLVILCWTLFIISFVSFISYCTKIVPLQFRIKYRLSDYEIFHSPNIEEIYNFYEIIGCIFSVMKIFENKTFFSKRGSFTHIKLVTHCVEWFLHDQHYLNASLYKKVLFSDISFIKNIQNYCLIKIIICVKIRLILPQYVNNFV